MRLEHDPEADAAYVRLSDKPYAYGIDLDEERRVDYDANDCPIGVEVLNISHGVNVEGLPFAEEIMNLLEKHGIEAYVVNVSAAGYSGTVFDVTLKVDEAAATDEAHEVTV